MGKSSKVTKSAQTPEDETCQPSRSEKGDSAGQAECSSSADPLYQMLKPLHNLPRGKNTWDPQFIKKPWFWPLSALVIIILFYIYPYVWDFFAG